MKIYLILVHLFMAIHIGGGIILSLACEFKTDWGAYIKELSPLWKKLSYLWILLFIPLVIVSRTLFPWDEFHGHKEIFFSQSYVLLRLFFYWILTIVAAMFFDRKPYLSIILYFIVGNFLSFDWAMSMEGHWFSNMYGFTYIANGTVGAMALFILGKFAKTTEKGRVDLSHLFITITILWFYLNFSQFIIIWMANLPREVVWYLPRLKGIYFILFLAFFALKVLPLLSIAFNHKNKINPGVLRIVTMLSLTGVVVEMIWTLLPGGHP
jgi:hypothetical protein